MAQSESAEESVEKKEQSVFSLHHAYDQILIVTIILFHRDGTCCRSISFPKLPASGISRDREIYCVIHGDKIVYPENPNSTTGV